MNKPDFNELVVALKGGSSKGVGFKPARPETFDGARDRKVVDAWLVEMEITFMPPRLVGIWPWNLPNPI
jgi:hypothetical protein